MIDKTKIGIGRIFRINNGGNLRAYVDVILDGSYCIKGLKIVEGKNGLFVDMPSSIGKDGNWYDIFVPMSKEAYSQLTDAIIEAYQKV